jgi:hypothetical protein
VRCNIESMPILEDLTPKGHTPNTFLRHAEIEGFLESHVYFLRKIEELQLKQMELRH